MGISRDVDALSHPKCNVPMVVLVFLTDPYVVYKIQKMPRKTK